MSADDYITKASAHLGAQAVCVLAQRHGVRRVFASSGARCAPLIIALDSVSGLRVESVVDERSAAFMALGYAEISGDPVMLVCTSGTALLNYMPAIAEAYYRRVPLIVVSADRAAEWIGQDDSQTLPQPGVMDRFVKQSVDIHDIAAPGGDTFWAGCRDINDSMISATQAPCGPVHINLHFDGDLSAVTSLQPGIFPYIGMLAPAPTLTTAEARALAATLASPRKVMIVCGFMPPSQKLTRAMRRLSELPNVAVLAEPLANIHADITVKRPDVACYKAPGSLAPDVLITTGGAVVSANLKSYLRGISPAEHWHVGITGSTIDTYRHLTRRINIAPETFFPLLASGMQPFRAPSGYGESWSLRDVNLYERWPDSGEWTSIKAVGMLLHALPTRWNLQVSNGMSVRLLQLFDTTRTHRISCNRGVSGIDGSTSTAVGASVAYRAAGTLLVTGDMSLQYDLTALGTSQVPNDFRIAVIENQGGNIFRTIKTTRDLPQLEERFALPGNFPIETLAKAWGWEVVTASDADGMHRALSCFFAPSDHPVLLRIVTSGREDAEAYRKYYKSLFL